MPIDIVYTIQDSDGDKATTSVRINGDATLAGVVGFAQAFADAIVEIIHGAIRRVDAILRPDTSALTNNTALAGSDVERQGKFEFVTAQGDRVKMNIPALLEAVGQGAGQDSLDLSDPDVAAFVSMMEDGLTVSAQLVQPCDVGEISIVGTIFAREAHKNSGKRA